jgi:epoxyqueuosine reductase
MRRTPPPPTFEEIRARLMADGAVRVGVAPADILHRARRALHERRRAGYVDSMQFTWRNPERSTDPSATVDGARSIIVVAHPCDSPDEPRPDGASARVARYARQDHHTPMRESLRAVARTLRTSGHRAVALSDDNALVDREVAHLAGIGWFGRNANLLIPGLGSHVVLGSIITTAEYATDTPVPDGCGSCTRCIDECPTGAIVSPGVIDARRCLAWILQRPGVIPIEFRVAIADRIYGCDDCQDSCPPTIRLSGRHSGRVAAPGPGQWIDAWEVLDATDDELLTRCGQWYIHARDPRWLRRNALVVIGNTADPADSTVWQRLDAHRLSNDPIIAEHADWAWQRLADRGTVGET